MKKNITNNKKPPLASIIYVQAAVFERTGIRVKLDDLMLLLLEENIITRGMIRFLEVPDLNKFGQSYHRTERSYDPILPVDRVVSDRPSRFAEKELEIERHSTQD